MVPTRLVVCPNRRETQPWPNAQVGRRPQRTSHRPVPSRIRPREPWRRPSLPSLSPPMILRRSR